MKAAKARMVGVKEFKARAAELVREMEETKEAVVITRRGKTVARLGPIQHEEPFWADSHAVWDRPDRLAQEMGKRLPEGTSAMDAVREQRRNL